MSNETSKRAGWVLAFFIAASMASMACGGAPVEAGEASDELELRERDIPKLPREFSLQGRFNGEVLPSEFRSLHLITDDPAVPKEFHGRAIRGVGGDCGSDCYLLGPFRYAKSADGKTYIRFYDNELKFAVRYEYKASRDALQLRKDGTNAWFEMTRDRNKGEACDGNVECAEGSGCVPVNCEVGTAGCKMVCE